MWPGSSEQKSTVITLQWTEMGAAAAAKTVELLARDGPDAVICSPVAVAQGTEVFLVHHSQTEPGVVLSCVETEKSFILNVRVNSPELLSAREEFQRDPGPLVVDSFITPEEEEAILQDLAKELEASSDKPTTQHLPDDSSAASSLLRLVGAVCRYTPVFVS